MMMDANISHIKPAALTVRLIAHIYNKTTVLQISSSHYHGSLSLVGRSTGWQSLIGGALDIEVLGEGAIAERQLFTSGTKLFGTHHVRMSTLKVLVHMVTTGLQQVELSTIQHNTAGPRRLPAETRCDEIRTGFSDDVSSFICDDVCSAELLRRCHQVVAAGRSLMVKSLEGDTATTRGSQAS